MEQASQIDEPIDGRKARSEKTRALIVEALMDLIEGGNLQPTSEEVAICAGVGHRTVFRHFQDMETLYREITTRMKARLEEGFGPVTQTGPLNVRITAFVKSRSSIYEKIKMYRRATMIRAWASPFLKANRKHYDEILRKQLYSALPEISQQPEMIQGAVELLFSFEAWEQLRVGQGRSINKARDVVEQGLLALMQR